MREPHDGDLVISTRWPSCRGRLRVGEDSRLFVHWEGTVVDDEVEPSEIKLHVPESPSFPGDFVGREDLA